MSGLLKILDRLLAGALVALMTALVVAVVWQVVSRYLFSDPSPWTEEVARFLLIWVGTLGAAYAFRMKQHIGLDLLPRLLAGASAQYLRLFTVFVVVLFAAVVLVLGGSRLVHLTWELRQYSPVLGIPIALVYSVIPITGVLIVIYSLVEPVTQIADTSAADET